MFHAPSTYTQPGLVFTLVLGHTINQH